MPTAEVTFSDGSTATITGTREEIEAAVREIEGTPLEGALESARSIAAGVVGEVVGGLAGIYGAVTPGPEGQGRDYVEATREAFRAGNAPESLTGKRYMQNIGEAAQYVDELPRDLTGKSISEGLDAASDFVSDQMAAKVSNYGAYGDKAAAVGAGLGAAVIPGAEIAAGARAGVGIGQAIPDPKPKRPRREDPYIEKRRQREEREAKRDMTYQGMDADMVRQFREAAPTDKNAMREMVDLMEKGLKNPKFGVRNYYGTPVGKNIKAEYDFVNKKRKEAGKKINEVARDQLKGAPVKYRPAVDRFLGQLEDMDIGYDIKTGKVDFGGSDIQGLPELEKTVNRLLERMRDPGMRDPDAYAVHKMKRWIDNNVSYSVKSEGLIAQVEILMKDLRHDLDAALDGQFRDYDYWNTVYKETRKATQAMQDATVSKIDLDRPAPNVERALSIDSRKVLSNYASGDAQIQGLDLLREAANKYGGKFEGDIVDQVMFVQQLRNAFPRLEERLRTFLAESGGVKSQDVRDPKGALLDKALEVGQEAVMGKRDEAARLKAFKRLLAEPTPRSQRIAGPPAERR